MKSDQFNVEKDKRVSLSCGCTIKDQTAELATMCKQHTEAYFMS